MAEPRLPARVRDGILRGVAAGWLQTGVRVLVGLVQVRLVLDYLGDELAGTWFLFLSLGAYVAFFDLGLSPTLSREIGFLLGRSADEEQRRRGIADLLATSQRVFGGLAATVFVLGLAGGALLLGQIAPAAERGPVLAAWVVFCAGASLNILGNAAFAALYGLGNVGVERSLQALTQLTGFGLLCLAIAFDFGLMGLSVAWALQGLLLRAMGWWSLRRLHPRLRVAEGQPSRALLRSLAGPSLKWMLMALGASLLFNTDNVLIAGLLGSDRVPAYHALVQVVTLAMQLSLLIVTSSTPYVSRAHAEGDRAQVQGLLLRNVRLGQSLMILIAAGLFVQGDLLMEIWLGPGNFAGWGVLVALVTMLLLETHHRVHAMVVMARGELVFHWWAVGAGLLNLAISLLLVGRLGLLGVALGTLIAQLLTNNWYAPLRSLRSLGLRFGPYARSVLLPLLLLLACSLIAGLAARLGLPAHWPALPRLLIGCGATAAVGGLVFCLAVADASERDAARRFFRGG